MNFEGDPRPIHKTPSNSIPYYDCPENKYCHCQFNAWLETSPTYKHTGLEYSKGVDFEVKYSINPWRYLRVG